MSGRYARGDLVTILGPWDDDPYILSFQHYGRVAEVTSGGYYLTLGSTWPPNQRFGPFPEWRLASGWRNPATGDWWIRT